MNEQQIFDAVQNIFRDNFDDDSLVLTRETTADDIEDWDSLEQINLLTAMEKQFGVKYRFPGRALRPSRFLHPGPRRAGQTEEYFYEQLYARRHFARPDGGLYPGGYG